ncbi:putative small heat shock protein 21 [Neospora caninum Liverpool]|uniref:Putative small heat shock protein 21 n=1 Tax=Neospora caninum (strain Liverpool) TaxID=572307 RepID=F0VN91_NEOCL|nr:putative small heat shock protein 21 [Neospora caninum Liverpool]CBZ55187.1 putative small heat shock protein 21 [Neospora caninum Liverpool]CEL69914.1 TPA: small heat shock protein 21, putative [Neospora caninum Liverpool]|eukprot:XP_003885215.1 putative small heat shock protein 21 [Neospora caninum Liverpool]
MASTKSSSSKAPGTDSETPSAHRHASHAVGGYNWDEFRHFLDSQGTLWHSAVLGAPASVAPNTIFELAPTTAEAGKAIAFRPRLDAYYDAASHKIVMLFDLPGFEKKDISVEVDDHAIIISGTRDRLKDKDLFGEKSRELIKERAFGHFCRKFQLPTNAVEESVSATMTGGVLEVTVETREQETSQTKKKIEIS